MTSCATGLALIESESIYPEMSPSSEVITHSPEETFALGRRIGEQITGRKVILLTGELGAGKTLFTKGVAAGLGIDPTDVTSPSFTLINVHEGRLRLYHVDLYRLESGARLDLGLDEILDRENVVTVIEWAERLGLLLAGATEVQIQYLSGSGRRITLRERASAPSR